MSEACIVLDFFFFHAIMVTYIMNVCNIIEVRHGLSITQEPGDLRFPNISDVTAKLSKHIREQFASGHALLDSRVTNRVASEAEFCTKTGVQRALGRKSEACET